MFAQHQPGFLGAYVLGVHYLVSGPAVGKDAVLVYARLWAKALAPTTALLGGRGSLSSLRQGSYSQSLVVKARLCTRSCPSWFSGS